jgi:hypothetical protein
LDRKNNQMIDSILIKSVLDLAGSRTDQSRGGLLAERRRLRSPPLLRAVAAM